MVSAYASRRAAQRRPSRRRHRIVLALSLLALALAFGGAERLLAGEEPPGAAPEPAAEAGATPLIYHLKLNTEVNGIMKAYLHRGLEEATAAGADLVVLEIHTPGGGVWTAVDMSKLLNTAKVPTLAWINTEGTSAGAMIAYACDDIVVARGGTIGDAIPIMMGSSGEIIELPEKYVGFVSQKIRANAEENGHDPDLAEAMVRVSIEIRYDDYARKMEARDIRLGIPERYQSPDEKQAAARTVTIGASHGQPSAEQFGKEYIIKKEQVLNLTAREALFLHVAVGRAEAIDAEVTRPDAERITDIEEFAHFRGAKIVTFDRSWSEVLAAFLASPLVSTLLLLGGIIGIATELKVPGFGFPGILGLVCIGLLFFAHMGAGAAKWTDLIFVVVGLVLLGIELFVIPGFGVVGILGIASIVAGLFMMLVPNMPEGLPPLPGQLWRAIALLAGAIAGSGVGIFLIYYFVLPRTQFLGALVLTSSQKHAAGYHASEGTELADPEKLIGRVGVARSKLRPAGRALFDGEPYDVVTQGDYINAGAQVEIIEVKSNRIVVRAHRPPTGGA